MGSRASAGHGVIDLRKFGIGLCLITASSAGRAFYYVGVIYGEFYFTTQFLISMGTLIAALVMAGILAGRTTDRYFFLSWQILHVIGFGAYIWSVLDRVLIYETQYETYDWW